jgi:hypothetical protein
MKLALYLAIIQMIAVVTAAVYSIVTFHLF